MSKRWSLGSIMTAQLAAFAVSCCWLGVSMAAEISQEISHIAIENFAFDPPLLTVKIGTKILFANRDQVPHSVVGFRDGKETFRSPEQIDTDETYAVIADKPGEIELRCGLHARIVGRILVKP